MKVEIDGNDLCAAVAEQRNNALDDAANNAAAIKALLRRIAALETENNGLRTAVVEAHKQIPQEPPEP